MRNPLTEKKLPGIYVYFVIPVLICLCLPLSCSPSGGQEDIRTGAEQMGLYLPMLQGKRLGIVANQTSVCEPSLTSVGPACANSSDT